MWSNSTGTGDNILTRSSSDEPECHARDQHIMNGLHLEHEVIYVVASEAYPGVDSIWPAVRAAIFSWLANKVPTAVSYHSVGAGTAGAYIYRTGVPIITGLMKERKPISREVNVNGCILEKSAYFLPIVISAASKEWGFK